MQSAIVTVRLSGSKQEYDLEVPAEVPSQQLAELITHNLSAGTVTAQPFIVRCLKPAAFRRPLGTQESLSEAGMWDGTYLEIEPVGAIASKEWEKIVERWEPLRLGDVGDVLLVDKEPEPADSLLETRTDVSSTTPIIAPQDDAAAVGAQDESSPQENELPQRQLAVDWEPIKIDNEASPAHSKGTRSEPDDHTGPEPPRTSDYVWKKL